MRLLMFRKRKYILWFSAGLLGICFLFWLDLRLFNNLLLASEESFNKSFELALQNAEAWISDNQEAILKRNNFALLKMLQECNWMHETPSGTAIISSYLRTPFWPGCWRALLEPEWPVDADELNKTIRHVYIDNKWILYAIAADKARVDPEQLGLFDPDRWTRRQLTHQLWALIHLRQRDPEPGKYDALIDHLCQRIVDDLWNDTAVVDIYIQKAAFVLGAGHPEMIKKRWVERIILNQNPDGGWDDRWMYFFRSARRPAWKPSKGSNQHATVQALWLLYQVKYKYADIFGIPASKNDEE